MATAQALIEAAYSRSTANDPGKLATDGELLGVLNRVYQLYYALKAVSMPGAHTTSSNVVLAAFIGAIPAEAIDIRRAEGTGGGVTAGAKVNIIPVEEKDRSWHLAPAMYRQGNSLISRQGAGDPLATDTIKLFYIDAPAALAALATATDARWPSRFDELLIVELAMYLSTKDAKRDPAEFTKLSSYRLAQVQAFFQLCGLSMTALQSPHGGEIIQTLQSMLASMSRANSQ